MENYDHSLRILLQKLDVTGGKPGEALLRQILSGFSLIPYENITKIVSHSREKRALSSFRTPDRVVNDFVCLGMGGTCFSLVYLFKKLVDYAGFRSYLVLADRKYGPNTHCAVMLPIGGELYLADPGYLIFHPLRLSSEIPVSIQAGPHDLLIEPLGGGARFDVFTLYEGGNRKFRYCIKNEEIDEGVFFDCWKHSFEFEMMNYIVVNRCDGLRHVYMRDRFLHAMEKGKSVKREMTPSEIITVAGSMGMSRHLVAEALAVLGKL
jgi:arylamine N-acetyltransferase